VTFTDANGVDLSPDETSVECRRVRDDPLGESRIGFEGAGIGWPEWTGAAQTSEYHFTRARVEVTDSVRAGFVCHRYLQPWTIDDDDLAADREQVDVIGEHCRAQARANSTTRRRNSRGCGRAIRTLARQASARLTGGVRKRGSLQSRPELADHQRTSDL
jgi:hypothetical protein